VARAGADEDDLLAAIEVVYRARFASFVRLAAAITRDQQTARDVVHDAFVRAVRYRTSFEARSQIDGWICRIVLNEARKRRGDDQRVLTAPSPPARAASTSYG
jgi:DNA-directed RNA polymerase specialized sigma24 family protein